MREALIIIKISSPCSPKDKKVGNGFEYQATAEVTGAARLTKNLFLAEGVRGPGSPIKKHQRKGVRFIKLKKWKRTLDAGLRRATILSSTES